MPTAIPGQEPITGNEELTDPREPLQALAEFYRALNSRDMALMEQNWDNTQQAAMDNPLGEIRRGWAEIKPVYERLFPRRRRVSFRVLRLHSAQIQRSLLCGGP